MCKCACRPDLASRLCSAQYKDKDAVNTPLHVLGHKRYLANGLAQWTRLNFRMQSATIVIRVLSTDPGRPQCRCMDEPEQLLVFCKTVVLL